MKELFNLLEDSKEMNNLFLTYSNSFQNYLKIVPMEKEIKIMQEENKKLNERLNQKRELIETDNETVEKLKSLGYVG